MNNYWNFIKCFETFFGVFSAVLQPNDLLLLQLREHCLFLRISRFYWIYWKIKIVVSKSHRQKHVSENISTEATPKAMWPNVDVCKERRRNLYVPCMFTYTHLFHPPTIYYYVYLRQYGKYFITKILSIQ